MNKKSLIVSWCAIIMVLTVLSYTQVDLNLTLLNWQPYLEIQKQFTHLGYFNRPANGMLFLLLGIGLCTGYITLVKAAYLQKISLPQLQKLAIFTCVALLFSYSVFSHDIFNYIFDARIITHYGQNPYEQKALDYPNDDWIRFMQWTHRTYPYGPTWLIITVVPSLVGLGKLLPTYFLFKALFSAAYLLMLHYAVKIFELKKMKPHALAAIFALLAFNPLIIIDGLVSPRIDLIMACLAIIAVYYEMKADRRAYFWLLVSAGTKFATLGFLPIFIASYQKLADKKFFYGLFIIAAISVPLQIFLRGVQPWYFILPITFLPFLYPHVRLRTLVVIAVVLLIPMTTYLHFIYTGISKDALWFLSP